MPTIDGRRCPCSAVYLCQRKRNILDIRDVKHFRRMHVYVHPWTHLRHLKYMQYTRTFCTWTILFVFTYYNYDNAVEFLFALVNLNATITYIPVIARFYLNNLHGAISARPECSSGYQRAAMLSYVCLSTHASKPRLSMRQQWLRSAL